MEKRNKKPNLFRAYSPRMYKIVTALFTTLAMIGGAAFIIAILQLISYEVSEPGMDIASLFKGFDIFMELLFAIFILLAIAFGSVFLYNYMINKNNYEDALTAAEAESPLTEAAKGHEQQIIDLMISIIKPVPGKKNISTAKAAKFIKALKDLNLMDVNMEGQHLIPWIETVTGFSAGKTSPFNQALKAVKVDDDDVPDYKAQLEQILAS
jgi:hypothetical protein